MTDRRGWFEGFAGGIASALMAVFLRPKRPRTYLCFERNDDGSLDSWEVDENLQGIPGTYRHSSNTHDPIRCWAGKDRLVTKVYSDGSSVTALPRQS